jgi:hypothetical protein
MRPTSSKIEKELSLPRGAGPSEPTPRRATQKRNRRNKRTPRVSLVGEPGPAVIIVIIIVGEAYPHVLIFFIYLVVRRDHDDLIEEALGFLGTSGTDFLWVVKETAEEAAERQEILNRRQECCEYEECGIKGFTLYLAEIWAATRAKSWLAQETRNGLLRKEARERDSRAY